MPTNAILPAIEYTSIAPSKTQSALPAVEYTSIIAKNTIASLSAVEWTKQSPSHDAVIGVFDEVGIGDYVSFDAVIGVFDEIVSESPAKRYVWDGSAWVRTPEYVWNGTAWQQIV